jgi:hypothetical protein
MKTKFSLCLWAALLLGCGTWASHCAASVRVYGQAHSGGPTITVQVFADIAGTPLVSCGVRLLYDPAVLKFSSAVKNEEAWFFADAKGRLAYADPEMLSPGEVLVLGAKLDLQSPLAGVAGDHVLIGSFEFVRLSPLLPRFGLAIGRASSFANFVTVDGIILDHQPGLLVFGEVTPDPADMDLDGLSDKWEMEYFGDTGSYYNDDPDKDGYNNLTEQSKGTNPRKPDTLELALTITRIADAIHLEWPGTEGYTYTVETSRVLPGIWTPFATALGATPPANSYEFSLTKFGPALFIRIVMEPLRQ